MVVVEEMPFSFDPAGAADRELSGHLARDLERDPPRPASDATSRRAVRQAAVVLCGVLRTQSENWSPTPRHERRLLV